MRLFRIRAETEEKEEKKDTQTPDEAILMAGMADDYITKEDAMNIPTFAGCVNLIADTVSTIPIRLYCRKEKQIDEVPDDERARMLNYDTGDTLDAVQFKRALVADYLTGKGGYAYINRTGTKVKSIHYVDETRLSFQYSADPVFKDYDIIVEGAAYRPYEFIKILRNTKDGHSGKSIVDENKEILSVAFHSLKYEKTLVKTGGNKKGFIKSPKQLTKEAMTALKTAWRKLYQNNSENVVILNNGLEFQEASNTSVDMQMNENKKTNSDEICKLFNMPPAMISGSTKEDDKINFVQYCLNPILSAIECALNRDLLLETEKGSYFYAADTSELTKGDIDKRFSAYEKACRNGFMQIDEIRFRENMPPLGLDFVRLGLQDVLYDPEKKEFYIPNMNQKGSLGKEDEKDADRIEK